MSFDNAGSGLGAALRHAKPEGTSERSDSEGEALGPGGSRSDGGQGRGGAPTPLSSSRETAGGRGEGGARDGGFLPATSGYGAPKLNAYGDPL